VFRLSLFARLAQKILTDAATVTGAARFEINARCSVYLVRPWLTPGVTVPPSPHPYVGHTDITSVNNSLSMMITLTGVSGTRHLWYCGQGRAPSV
jgi:hypothetical protein